MTTPFSDVFNGVLLVGGRRLTRRLPDIFAHRHTEGHAPTRTSQTGPMGRLEVPGLIEHVVGRKELLSCDHLTLGLTGQRSRRATHPNHAVAGALTSRFRGQRCADERRHGRRDVECHRHGTVNEIGLEQQVTGRVPAHRQFRGNSDGTSRCFGLAKQALDARSVAPQVTHFRVHLKQGDGAHADSPQHKQSRVLYNISVGVLVPPIARGFVVVPPVPIAALDPIRGDVALWFTIGGAGRLAHTTGVGRLCG